MNKEIQRLLERLAYPLELIESLIEQRVASIRSTPTASKIFIGVCYGFVMFLALSTYLFIAVILTSILLVASWLERLSRAMLKLLTGLLEKAHKPTSTSIPELLKLLTEAKK
jgi:hypothetical protein